MTSSDPFIKSTTLLNASDVLDFNVLHALTAASLAPCARLDTVDFILFHTELAVLDILFITLDNVLESQFHAVDTALTNPSTIAVIVVFKPSHRLVTIDTRPSTIALTAVFNAFHLVDAALFILFQIAVRLDLNDSISPVTRLIRSSIGASMTFFIISQAALAAVLILSHTVDSISDNVFQTVVNVSLTPSQTSTKNSLIGVNISFINSTKAFHSSTNESQTVVNISTIDSHNSANHSETPCHISLSHSTAAFHTSTSDSHTATVISLIDSHKFAKNSFIGSQ